MYPPLGVSVSACGWICNDPDHGSIWVRDKPLMCQQWRAMPCVHTVQAPLVCRDVGWDRVGSKLREGTSSHACSRHVWRGVKASHRGEGHSVTATATTHVRDVRRGSTHPIEGKAIARQQQQPHMFETCAGGQRIRGTWPPCDSNSNRARSRRTQGVSTSHRGEGGVAITRQQQQPRTFETYAGGQRIRWVEAIARQQSQLRMLKTCAGGSAQPATSDNNAAA